MKQEILERLKQAKREDIEEALASVINLCMDYSDWEGSIYQEGWKHSRLSLFEICELEQFIK